MAQDRRLYGSDAIGGTINFVTKKPESKELKLMGRGRVRLDPARRERRLPAQRSPSYFASRDFSTGFALARLPQRSVFQRNVPRHAHRYDERLGGGERPAPSATAFMDRGIRGRTGTKFVTASQTFGRDPDRLQ
ncbi:MAG: hypothetical protein R2748_12090 [Bryobacterales bacterium]